MQPSGVTITANKFDPNTQAFTPATPTISPSLATFNQSMVNAAPPAQTISSGVMKPVTPVPLATPKNTTTSNISSITQVAADLANQESLARQKELDAINQQGKSQSKEVAAMQALLGGRSGFEAQTYEAQGVNKAYNQIADLNAQATGLLNEAKAIPIQIQNEFKGTGATDAGVAPIETARLRDNALKALSLGQQAAIANAQYDKAKNYADQLVNAKYDQIEADITAKLTNLQALKDFDLTPAQTKAADARTRALEYQREVESEKKAVQLKNNELLINAASIGAPSDVQSKAKAIADRGGSSVEVAQALGVYAGNYFQNQALQIELRDKKIADLAKNGVGGLPVGSMTKDLGITVEDYMKGIAGTESAGSRDAYGGTDPYKVLSGQKTIADFNAMSQKEKENTAYGKYQVMGFNIPKWTKEAFGQAMTIQEFLNSPEKQDALIRFQAEQNYAKYGNWDDVAAVWFSGQPASGNTRSDKFGTSTPSYITKYRNNMGITAGTTGASAEVKAYSDAIDRGEYKDINAIPEKYQTEVAKYRANKPTVKNPAQVEALRGQLENLNNATALIGGVGGMFGANIAGANPIFRTDLSTIFTGDKATALGYIDNILSGETLQALIKAKEAGATFGALSNQELGLLERSASVLNKWAIRDDVTGELQGFKVGDASVNAELQKLKEKIMKGIGETGGVDENTKVADDIYDMQARTYGSTTATYNLFNN